MRSTHKPRKRMQVVDATIMQVVDATTGAATDTAFFVQKRPATTDPDVALYVPGSFRFPLDQWFRHANSVTSGDGDELKFTVKGHKNARTILFRGEKVIVSSDPY